MDEIIALLNKTKQKNKTVVITKDSKKYFTKQTTKKIKNSAKKINKNLRRIAFYAKQI
jgi:hypothetical protein